MAAYTDKNSRLKGIYVYFDTKKLFFFFLFDCYRFTCTGSCIIMIFEFYVKLSQNSLYLLRRHDATSFSLS